MALCQAGHVSQTTDFCDQCGLPIVVTATTPAQAAETSADGPSACPNCGAAHPRGALFCEACGYDYTTGAVPRVDLRTELGLKRAAPTQSVTPPGVGVATELGWDSTGASPTTTAKATNHGDGLHDAGPSHDTKENTMSDDVAVAAPASTSPVQVEEVEEPKDSGWVAELWVDPQWYALQESDDPLPPAGAPRIIPLKGSALIGRHSASRNIVPDIDCDPDAGCSRRQAYLTFTDGYWYINDLDSANGTFVAPATEPLPTEPIVDRVHVSEDDRIYVGAWTRIVLRPATADDPGVLAQAA